MSDGVTSLFGHEARAVGQTLDNLEELERLRAPLDDSMDELQETIHGMRDRMDEFRRRMDEFRRRVDELAAGMERVEEALPAVLTHARRLR